MYAPVTDHNTLPDFNEHGVLPPYVQDTLRIAQLGSPYITDIQTFIETFTERFPDSYQRRTFLRELLTFRGQLRACGEVHGFQWIAGSFVEQIENSDHNRGPRSPHDIDIINFVSPQNEITKTKLAEFMTAKLRRNYDEQPLCDVRFLELTLEGDILAHEFRHLMYLCGFYCHQKRSERWKGVVQIPLENDEADQSARRILES